jgi:AbrB family looped-hinge helix DNA binding protein
MYHARLIDLFEGIRNSSRQSPLLDERRLLRHTYYALETDVNTVIVSPEFQVVIPLSVREEMGIRVGERFEVISFADRIELVRLRPMREMRGFLKGLDVTFRRGEDERA